VGHQRDERRLRTQLAVARILADSPSADAAAAVLLQAIGEGLGWDVGIFWTAERETGRLRCTDTWQREGVAVGPFLEATARTIQGRGIGLAGRAWESCQPVWDPDSSLDPAFLRRAAAAEVGLHGGFWIPVLLAGEVCGVIECFSRDIRQAEPGVIQLATAVGSQIGQFLQRKQAEAGLRQLNAELEERVAARTAELAAANKELEAFAYSVSHDMRAPLRTIDGFSQALLEDCSEGLGPEGQDYLQRIRSATRQMSGLIDDILRLSRVMRGELHRERINLTAMAESIGRELQQGAPERQVAFRVDPGLAAVGDERLLRVMLQNLLANAWKFTGKQPQPEVHFGAIRQGKETVFCVADNGAGFDMQYADRLFVPFQRLHTPADFEGTGIGLATVQRIVGRHGGRIWAEGQIGAGATFFFTLP
jgi:signal transduction histidine kinase